MIANLVPLFPVADRDHPGHWADWTRERPNRAFIRMKQAGYEEFGLSGRRDADSPEFTTLMPELRRGHRLMNVTAVMTQLTILTLAESKP